MTKATPGQGTNRIVEYLQDTRAEMRKVVWPTQEEAMNLTIVVLFITLLMTILLGGLDLLFAQMLEVVVDL